MLKFDKILTEDQSSIYSSRVLNCKDIFNNYGDNKFSILGAASYANSLNEYILIRNKSNSVIEYNFIDLLHKVKEYIESQVNEECIFNEDLSYPGFHIFYANHETSLLPLTSLHVDTPYELHRNYFSKKYNAVDFDFPLTFTLALQLPKSGGALYYWDKKDWEKQTEEKNYEFYSDIYNRYEKIFESGVPSTEDYEKFLEPKILNYQIGNMVLFKGNLLHQIAPFFEPVCENELRITLQGHGLKCDGKWILYF
jgi:hypothetical protein